MSKYKKILEKIKKYDVISFDIFDTLIYRKYLKPKDLFFDLELKENTSNFSRERINTENKLRKSKLYYQEITLNEIYENIDRQFYSLKEKEILYEINSIYANKEMLKVFNYAKKLNKKIVIISDTYFDENFITQILKSNGFEGWYKIYLSSEYKVLKRWGKLYKIAIKDLNVSANKILHIGDNFISDFISSKINGISSIYYKSSKKIYFENNKFLKQYSKEKNINSFISFLLSDLFEKRNINYNNYFENFGYLIAGVTVYSFARFVYTKAIEKNVDHLFLTARDGYLINEIFKLMNIKNISFSYVPLSRHQTDLCDNDKNYFELFTNYIRNQIPINAKKLAVVDTLTINFSAQKLIKNIIPDKEIIGLYWSTRDKTNKVKKYKHYTFAPIVNDIYDSSVLTYQWDIFEFIFSSPTPPIERIDKNNNFIYKEVTKYDIVRMEKFNDMFKGIINFIKEYKNVLKENKLIYSDIIKFINCFLLNPSKNDYDNMSVIFHSRNSGHNRFVPVLSYKPSIKQILLHPVEYYINLIYAYWFSNMQTILSFIFFPVRLCYLKKKLYVFLFPKLKKKYFSLNFYLLEIGLGMLDKKI